MNNSYIIKGKEHSLLVGIPNEITPDLADIDYLVITNIDVNQMDALLELQTLNPKITVYGISRDIMFIMEYTQVYIENVKVVSNMDLDLGGRKIQLIKASNVNRSKHQNRSWRKTFTFLQLPNWQWSDSLYVYDEETKDFYSGQLFSSTLDNDDDRYLGVREFFLRNIIPFYRDAAKNLNVMSKLDVATVYPIKGRPIEASKAIAIYKELETAAKFDDKLIALPYVSNSGLTKVLAETIAKGIESDGIMNAKLVDVSVFDGNFDGTDSLEERLEIIQTMYRACAIVAGSPTIEGNCAKAMSSFFAQVPQSCFIGKVGAAFGNYSYAAKSANIILDKMENLSMRTIKPAASVRFKPDEESLQLLTNFGLHIGRGVLHGEISDFKNKNIVAEVPHFNTNRKFVIIGNGAGGTAAAQHLRKLDSDCEIEIIDKRPYNCYNRIAIGRGILGDADAHSLCIRPDKWYEKLNIKKTLGVEVLDIDCDAKKITCSDGITRTYDKLIYAAGSLPYIPDIKGIDSEGVYPMHSIEDVMHMHDYIKKHECSNVTIIGGGILALKVIAQLHNESAKTRTKVSNSYSPFDMIKYNFSIEEAAKAAKKAKDEVEISDENGLKITITEGTANLMPRHLDAQAGDIVRTALERNGIKVVCNANAVEIISDTDENGQYIKAIRYSNGEVVPTDLVILCSGINENTSLLPGVEGAVEINEKAETGIPDVYACGDCASFDGVNTGRWSQATEMGKTAAYNAVGAEFEYLPEVSTTTYTEFGLELFSIGDIRGAEAQNCETMARFNPLTLNYEKHYIKNGKLTAAILLGNADSALDLIQKFEK